jgi:hypothetical protein
MISIAMKPDTKSPIKKSPRQKRTKKTRPGVFIIESLDFEDEQQNRFEGRILRDMLRLSENEVEYWYERTWRELTEEIFQRFWDSGMRYLHLSCHGSSSEKNFCISKMDSGTSVICRSNRPDHSRVFLTLSASARNAR